MQQPRGHLSRVSTSSPMYMFASTSPFRLPVPISKHHGTLMIEDSSRQGGSGLGGGAEREWGGLLNEVLRKIKLEDDVPLVLCGTRRADCAGDAAYPPAEDRPLMASFGTLGPAKEEPVDPALSDVMDLTSPMQIMSSLSPTQPQPPKLEGEATKRREHARTEGAGQLVKRRRTSEAWERRLPLHLEQGRLLWGWCSHLMLRSGRPDEMLVEPDDGSCRVESMVHRKNEPEEEAQDVGMGGAGCVEDEVECAFKHEAGVAAASKRRHVPAPEAPAPIQDTSIFVTQEPAPSPSFAPPPAHVRDAERRAHMPHVSRKEQINTALHVVSFPENAVWKDC
ncbi:hypothetical protein B0H21DRAFT_826701 [Amylocystis lapponica]|nr:hypothetical protein B0H21DRAFT_826701 [Amylocystis lapponica]